MAVFGFSFGGGGAIGSGRDTSFDWARDFFGDVVGYRVGDGPFQVNGVDFTIRRDGEVTSLRTPSQTVNVTVNPTSERYYDVSGETANEAIGNSTITCGNTKSAGCTDYSITRTTGRISPRTEKRGRSFVAIATAASTVTVDVDITLPNWIGYEVASARERAIWDSFISTLRKHEQGHAERAVSGARRLAANLPSSALATARSERMALSAAVYRLRSRILEATSIALSNISMAQRQYDVETNYGRNQP